MIRKLVKAGPSKKRNTESTLSSFKNFDFHIDIIGYCYEIITEFSKEDIVMHDTEMIKDIYKTTEAIQYQLGLEKYIELLLFIEYLKKSYVTDLRDKTYNISNKKCLVFFDDDEKNIKDGFDAVLINKEMEKFAVDGSILKMMAKNLKIAKGKK